GSMRLRKYLVLGAAGLLGAWILQNSTAAYTTIVGCCILASLRSIHYQLCDLKSRIQPAASYKLPTDEDLLFAWAYGRSREKLLETLPDILSGKPSDK